MSRQVVVVEPGQGDRVGNVQFLARTVDTPFFNLSEVVLRPGQGVDSHVHQAEDDSWLVLDGTLSVTVGDDARRIEAGPGTFVLVPSGTSCATTAAPTSGSSTCTPRAVSTAVSAGARVAC
jgi:mannose-6-phosphate isomerase-like protein (cupin superfamily)